MDLLDTVAQLSHDFGGPDHVLGGGGNTSCKDASTLWIKPSGTKLCDMTRDSFAAMDRAKIAELYSVAPPETDAERERVMKDVMLAAVHPGSQGRPSVETPVHNLFEATYVVHVHPPLVNGLTCAEDGKRRAAELFPDAVWVEYSAGFMLNRVVRKRIDEYAEERGREATAVFLENHGIIFAGDDADGIRSASEVIMDRLRDEYSAAGVATEIAVGPAPAEEDAKRIEALIRESVGEETAASVKWSGPFETVDGPVTPDHIVYSKAWFLREEPSKGAIAEFREKRGYAPRVVVLPEGVYALGPNDDTARLALEFAQDAGLVRQLAAAFGGLKYLDARWSDFIEGWEVEAYRRKLAREGKA
jgi:rhamnose utilization protein RhaD (predicted bifunctional aldolase and dehydrogenase)